MYRQRIASQASGYADFHADAGLFDVTIITAGGKSEDAAEKAALAEIDKIKTEPVAPSELEKARNILLSDALQARETAAGQAFALGEAAVTLGDPERVNTDISRLQAVTAADVQRVAQKYFTPENRVVIRYENGKAEQGGQSNAPKEAPPFAPTAFTPQETPPPPTAPRPVRFPTPVEKRLPNGVRVIVAPRPGSGLVSVEANLRAGGVYDPNKAAGLADFTASLLTRGTKTRTAPQIAETVEALGGSLSSGAGWDGATVSLSSLAARLTETLPVFAEAVRAPAFSAEEIERLRSENLDNLAVSLRRPGTLARLSAARVVFGDSGYGHALSGTPESLKALNAKEIRQFYQGRYQPGNAILVFGGDITPDAAFALAAQFFGDWKPSGQTAPPFPAAAIPQKGGRVVVIDKPDAGQAAVLLARPTIRRADKAYSTGRVANAVLGEGFSSRLNQEVRIKRGLSYGAGSNLETRRDSGLFVASAQTRNDAVPEVAALLKTELTRLTTDAIPAPELVTRKASLSGDYARDLETGAGLSSVVAGLAAQGLPLSALNDYLKQVENVSPNQIQQFAAKSLNAGDASLIIVGDARQFLPALKKRFPNVEVIPADKLDLNAARLMKH